MSEGTPLPGSGLLGDGEVERHRVGMAALSTGREAARRAKKMSTKVHGARLGNVPDGDCQFLPRVGEALGYPSSEDSHVRSGRP